MTYYLVMGNCFEITINYPSQLGRFNQLGIDCTIGQLPILNHTSYHGQKQPTAVSGKKKETSKG